MTDIDRVGWKFEREFLEDKFPLGISSIVLVRHGRHEDRMTEGGELAEERRLPAGFVVEETDRPVVEVFQVFLVCIEGIPSGNDDDGF